MSTDLVKSEPVAEVPALIPADPLSPQRQMVSFLDPNGEGAEERVMRVVTGEQGVNWKSAVGEIVHLVGVTYFTRRVSKDEEPVRFGVYMALHLLDGRDIVTAGRGPTDDMGIVVSRYGRPPWPKGIPVVLTKVERDGKRTRYGLYPMKEVRQEEAQ